MNKYYFFHEKAALHIAVEKENWDIVNLLLQRTDLDVNARSISNFIFLNVILNYKNSSNFNLYLVIESQYQSIFLYNFRFFFHGISIITHFNTISNELF